MLDLPRIAQLEDFWCWAACAQMVLEHFGSTERGQCEIAGLALSKDCCSDSRRCNRRLFSTATKPPSVQHLYASLQITLDHQADAASVAEVQAEISADRPVQAFLVWNSGNGHVVIIYGWIRISHQIELMVHDPHDGDKTTVTYQGLLTAYGEGRWAETFHHFSR